MQKGKKRVMHRLAFALLSLLRCGLISSDSHEILLRSHRMSISLSLALPISRISRGCDGIIMLLITVSISRFIGELSAYRTRISRLEEIEGFMLRIERRGNRGEQRYLLSSCCV